MTSILVLYLKFLLIHLNKDKDGNPVVMTSSTAQAIEFDTFLEDYLKAIYAKAAKTNSVDAFCLLDGKYCLIEFKNGEIDKRAGKE